MKQKKILGLGLLGLALWSLAGEEETAPPSPPPTGPTTPTLPPPTGPTTPTLPPPAPKTPVQRLKESVQRLEDITAPPLTEPEFFEALLMLQPPSPEGWAIPNGLINAFYEDQLDFTCLNGWLQCYVALAQKLGAYNLKSSDAGSAVAGAAAGAATSGITTAGGSAKNFGVAAVKGILATLGAVINLYAAVADDKERQDKINKEILKHTGPPPALLDELLLHGTALATFDQTRLSPFDDRSQNRLNKYFVEMPVFFSFGALMLLLQLQKLKIPQPPPLTGYYINMIGRNWTTPQRPVQFLPADYVINGPPWLRYKENARKELKGETLVRHLERVSLESHYRQIPEIIRIFHLHLTKARYLSAESNLARFKQLFAIVTGGQKAPEHKPLFGVIK